MSMNSTATSIGELLPSAFITGCQRSGTTLLNLILSSHPDIKAFDENDFNPARLGDYLGNSRYAPFVCFKVPMQAATLLQNKVVANSHIVWCVRDPRDVITSMMQLSLEEADGSVVSWAAHSCGARLDIARCRRILPDTCYEDIQRQLAQYDYQLRKPGSQWTPIENLRAGALCWRLKNEIPAQYEIRKLDCHVIQYEAMTCSPKSSLTGLLEYLGLPWSERVMAHHMFQTGRSIGGTDNERAIDTGSIGRWRTALDPVLLAIVKEICGARAADFGYDVVRIESLSASDVHRYQKWERSATAEMQARYNSFRPAQRVFRCKISDVPKVFAGTQVMSSSENTINLRVGQQRAKVTGIDVELAEAALFAARGKLSISQIARKMDGDDACQRLLAVYQTMLGVAVGLPETIHRLSNGIRKAEIVRFPGQSPYALLRPYWENSVAVRYHCATLYKSLDDFDRFRKVLSECHQLATVGFGGRNYYGGYGGVVTVPGGFRDIVVSTSIPPSMVSTLTKWLAELGIDENLSRDRRVYDLDGCFLSKVCEKGTQVVHARPDGKYLNALLERLALALRDMRSAVTQHNLHELNHACARFHQIFVNGHFFHNINNSIAMNIVNDCLRESGQGFLPHLLLDYVAQRVDAELYPEVFDIIVNNYALAPGRTRENLSRRKLCGRLYKTYIAARGY